MAKTPAIRFLEKSAVSYTLHSYPYVERGGTKASSSALGVAEHIVIKSLIFETETKAPILVLMHGDKQVSTKALARHIGVKSISPCKPQVAQKHSGYQVGGTSPFGTKKAMPIYMQDSIADLESIYINAGKRGLLAMMNPKDIVRLLAPTLLSMSA